MQIAIRPLRTDDPSDLAAAYRIVVDADRREMPDNPRSTLADFVSGITVAWHGTDTYRWLAEADGVPAGFLRIDLPQLENTDNAEVSVSTHPDHQRRGIGRALYRYAMEFVRGQGRKRIQSESVDQLPGGPDRLAGGTAFARAMGARSVLPEVRRRLDLATAPDHAPLLAEARAASEGYTVLRWLGRTPDELLADIALLDSRLLVDAPIGDLTVEPERIDAARARINDETSERRGRQKYQTGARHDATGRLVAWTMIKFDAGVTEHAWQQITIVDPAHRGHRLGLLVKIENLIHTRAHVPALRTIDTWNAAENAHMIAINEAMGFRPLDAWHAWQHDL